MIIIIYNITHNNILNQHVTNPQHDNQHYGVVPFALLGVRMNNPQLIKHHYGDDILHCWVYITTKHPSV